MDAATLQAILDNQAAQAEARHKATLEAVIAQLQGTSSKPSEKEQVASSLAQRITTFVYIPEEGITFHQWYERFGKYFTVEGATLADDVKVRLLLSKIASGEYKLYSQHIAPINPDTLTFEVTITNLKNLFPDKLSVTTKRYDLLRLRQGAEDFRSFGATINSAAENAKAALTMAEAKCFYFTIGLNDKYVELKTKCLKHLDEKQRANEQPALNDLIEMCSTAVALRDTAIQLSSSSPQSLKTLAVVKQKPQRDNRFENKVSRSKNSNFSANKPPFNKGGNKKWSGNHKTGSQSKEQNSGQSTTSSKTPTKPCRFCAKTGHWGRECDHAPTCTGCNRKGHALHECEKAAKVTTGNIQVNTYASKIGKSDFWDVKVFLDNKPTNFVLDTGSDATIIGRSTWAALGKPRLTPTKVQGRGYPATSFSFKGTFTSFVSKLPIPVNAASPPLVVNRLQLECYVSEIEGSHNLMGLPWIKALGLLTLVVDEPQTVNSTVVDKLRKVDQGKTSIVQVSDSNALMIHLQTNFKSVFEEGLGKCTMLKAHLYLKPDVKPVFCKARPVSQKAQEAIEAELDRLLSIGAIRSIDYSSWAAPFVAVGKRDGKLRLCSDFSTGLNDCLELNRHPLPRPDYILQSLDGCKFFSQLDMKDAYLQLELDEASKKLCVINTHRGLFQYTRVPFGVKSAPAIFQQLVDNMIAGLKHVVAYLDDIIVAAPTRESHNQAIEALFKRIQLYGLRLKLSKCTFLKPKIKFLGQVVSDQGIEPDPDRLAALKNLPAPHNVAQLRSFLGALNYYGRYIKEMRAIRAPLDDLLKKEVPWTWVVNGPQEVAFEKAKSIICSQLTLSHFNPNLPIIVSADASNLGIGATLSQRSDGVEKILEHASWSLSPAQKNYSQIEKEALALVTAVQRFHRLIYGRTFTLRTDHKPLLAIFGSKTGIPIYTASRLQRWALILSNYSFTIQYVKTESFGSADVLSRLIANSCRPAEEVVISTCCLYTDWNFAHVEVELSVNVMESVDELPIPVKDIVEATASDETLQEVLRHMRDGWPKKSPKPELDAYFVKRDSLSLVEGCLFYSHLTTNRIIIPEGALRTRVLKALHLGHPGIQRMKSLARLHVYWPGLDVEVERTVKLCTDCQETAKCPTKATLSPWPTTSQVLERIHLDFAGPCADGNTYLLIIDAHSKWPEITCMPTAGATTRGTLKILNSYFHRFGFPKLIMSDNGSQFRSAEFDSYCKKHGIKQCFSPPFHPQCNGQVERLVDTFKRNMQKCRWSEEGLQTWLLSYRTTPMEALSGRSPADVFLQRTPRTILSLLKPDLTADTGKVVDRPQSKESVYRDNMSYTFNRQHGAKPTLFSIQDPVYVLNYRLNKKYWLPGRIVGLQGARTYQVYVPTLGATIHRHANQMRPRPEEYEDFTDDQSNEVVEHQPPPHSPNAGQGPRAPFHSPAPQKQATPVVNQPQLRRSTRHRRSPKKFSPDPQKKSYQ
jgi:hypothetical protein